MSLKEDKKKSKIYIRDSHRIVTKLHCKAKNNKKIAIEEALSIADSMVLQTSGSHFEYEKQRKKPVRRFAKWMNSNSWQYRNDWRLSYDEWVRVDMLVETADSINKSK